MPHLPLDSLSNEIDRVSTVCQVGSEYVHNKSGRHYEVVGYAVIEATDQVAIEYIDPVFPNIKFIRPFVEWDEEVEIDGKTTLRFTMVSSMSNKTGPRAAQPE